MATVRFSVGPGKSLEDVTEAVGAATVSNAIEITIDQAAVVNDGGTTRSLTKAEVLLAIELLEDYIVRRNWL